MSLPSSGYGGSRRFRAPSLGSNSSPRLIPTSPGSRVATSSAGADEDDDSFGGESHPPGRISSVSGKREPTRSSVHLTYRGPAAPIDTSLYAQSVREDTAELAYYALSDRGSTRSISPPRHQSRQSTIESYFSQGGDIDSTSTAERGRHETIQEVSEPVSPESGPSSHRSPGTSIITSMLRRSPPSTSPKSQEGGMGDEEEGVDDEENTTPKERLVISSNGAKGHATERTPLLGKDARTEHHPDWIHAAQDVEGQELRRRKAWPRLRTLIAWPKERGLVIAKTVINPKKWDGKFVAEQAKATSGYLPAVLLGVLLNILDALSYGMILFPLGQPIFEKLGPAGISMFYVSCIVSQLVYSSGGSTFKGGVGSEMIEVVPFFHKMAFTILKIVGEENPEAVIATTITAYAISSVLTGVVFFLMGTFNFGYIVGFIPRHILIGCIGGVGWFLFATGIEVTARLEGNLNYDIATLRKLLEADTIALWTIPLVLAIILYSSQHRVDSKYYLPIFILAIPTIFYFFVGQFDEITMPNLRRTGWVFDGPEAGQPWWYFYTLYKFKIVHWDAIAETIPAMFALTFFGILHVPINIPSLAFSIGEDNMDLDRELIAHGISNTLSGFSGSIQNYLVYTNSVLFIKSGGDSRVAGFLLAVATFGVCINRPWLIGYIPVMMVGTLIYILGFELLFEAVWLPRKKLKKLEYLTVIAIVLIMGIYDFVVGIFVGIGLAFVSLVVQTSRVPAVRASYSGEIAGSTVRRNPAQQGYLREVGRQIHVTKLAGYLFFGTIVSVEERIRLLIEEEAFNQRPIRFLVFDLWHVTGIDYSTAEAFNRLNRVFNKKGVTLVLSGVNTDGPLGESLLAVGLGQDGLHVAMHSDLNSALESCENELLKTYYSSRDARTSRNAPVGIDVPTPEITTPIHTLDTQFSSPRRNQLHRVATLALDENPSESRYSNFKAPLPLILNTFQGLTDKNEDFWFRLVPYLVKKTYLKGTILYHAGEAANGFYILEDGILRTNYNLPQGMYYESIVAGTTCGELPFFSETRRTATVLAERDSVAWLLDRENWDRLQEENKEVAQELLRIGLKLTSERMSAITSYVLTTAG